MDSCFMDTNEYFLFAFARKNGKYLYVNFMRHFIIHPKKLYHLRYLSWLYGLVKIPININVKSNVMYHRHTNASVDHGRFVCSMEMKIFMSYLLIMIMIGSTENRAVSFCVVQSFRIIQLLHLFWRHEKDEKYNICLDFDASLSLQLHV